MGAVAGEKAEKVQYVPGRASVMMAGCKGQGQAAKTKQSKEDKVCSKREIKRIKKRERERARNRVGHVHKDYEQTQTYQQE